MREDLIKLHCKMIEALTGPQTIAGQYQKHDELEQLSRQLQQITRDYLKLTQPDQTPDTGAAWWKDLTE